MDGVLAAAASWLRRVVVEVSAGGCCSRQETSCTFHVS